MMGQVKGKAVDPGRFSPFQALKVLYDFDGPRSFTFLDGDGELNFALWFDENTEFVRYLVVPFSDDLVARLVKGQMSLREAIDQPRLWIVDVNADGTPQAAIRTHLSDLPEEELPVPGTMLLPSLEPLLSLRAIGEPIQPSAIPGSVIKFVIEGAQRAMKGLAEYELEKGEQLGRRLGAIRRLQDLPAQTIRVASFEVSFRSPIREPGLFEGLGAGETQEELAALDNIGKNLRAGLEWLTDGVCGRQELPVPDDQERSRVIVQAMRSLTPPSHGPIREVELRGRLVQKMERPFRLNRNTRSVVNATLRRFPTPSEHSVRLVGRIRELDADRLRFELREIADGATTRECLFDEDLWDEVHDLLGEEAQVEVLGRETSPNRPVEVAVISRLRG